MLFYSWSVFLQKASGTKANFDSLGDDSGQRFCRTRRIRKGSREFRRVPNVPWTNCIDLWPDTRRIVVLGTMQINVGVELNCIIGSHRCSDESE